MYEQGDEIKLDTDSPPPPGQSNRTFKLAAGVMAGIVFLTIALMAAYVIFLLPRIKANQSSVQATILAQNELISQAMTQTMAANILGTRNAATVTPTPTPTYIVLVSHTPTPVLAIPTQTLSDPNAALTATKSALNTQIAQVSKTPTVTPGGPLPKSGFAEDVGLPGLLLMSLGLLMVILLARRLRAVPIR